MRPENRPNDECVGKEIDQARSASKDFSRNFTKLHLKFKIETKKNYISIFINNLEKKKKDQIFYKT